MAMDSPHSIGKKRKVVTSNIDKSTTSPVSTTLEHPQDFLTDSLFAASPSPAAQLRAGTAQRQLRPSSSTPTRLDGARNATASGRYISKHPALSRRLSDVVAKESVESRLPKPSFLSSASFSHSTRDRQVETRVHMDTESSPAREYAETYQRIDEEETLASEDAFDEVEEESQRDVDDGSISVTAPTFDNIAHPCTNTATSAFDTDVGLRGESDNSIPQHVSSAMTGSSTSSSLGSVQSQYARDLHRLQGALQSRPKAFRKARTIGGSLDAGDRLPHRDSDGSVHSSPVAGSRNGSDPGSNVPRAWGRRARTGTDWLHRNDVRKLESPGMGVAQPTLKADSKSPFLSNGLYESVEGAESYLSPPRSPSNVPSVQPASWTMDDDFTGRSVEISDSPPVRLRNSASVSPHLQRLLETAKQSQGSDPPGVMLANTSGSPPKSSFRGSRGQGTVRTASPHHERNVQHSLQQSSGLADQKARPIAVAQPTRPESRLQAPKAYREPSIKTPVITGAWVDATPGGQIAFSKQLPQQKTPFITGGWVDTPAQTKTNDRRSDPSSKPEEDRLRAEDVLDSKEAYNKHADGVAVEIPYTGPPLAESALQNILRQARGELTGPAGTDSDPPLQLGEETMMSLENLIVDELEPRVPTASRIPSNVEDALIKRGDLPDSSTGLDHTDRGAYKSDLKSYAKILNRLEQLVPSIRDSKKNLSQVERVVAEVGRRPGDSDLDRLARQDWPCTRCGCRGATQSRAKLSIMIPRLWYWTADSLWPHVTRLGLFTALVWLLVAAEYFARYRYCHPRFARSMSGFGVDIDAPQPPFVLAKVILRQSGVRAAETPVKAILRVCAGIVFRLVRYLVDFMFGSEEQVQRGYSAQTMETGWPGADSMMNDEYL